MPAEVLTGGQAGPEDLRPVAGFFGKLPLTGDFVARGLPDRFRRPWDAWLSRHIVPLQRKGLPFPAGGIRFRLPSGARLAAGVILPSEDSAGRLFPLTLLLFVDGDLSPAQIDTWCEKALELHPETLSPDVLWHALDALPAPDPKGCTTGTMQLWAVGIPPASTAADHPVAALKHLFSRS